ncbi:uncharacterized protein TNCV_500941 [Trichonephila clavipes]|nr:uncharacterized protein TNCV_500941 [Trichonephila clavipes]
MNGNEKFDIDSDSESEISVNVSGNVGPPVAKGLHAIDAMLLLLSKTGLEAVVRLGYKRSIMIGASGSRHLNSRRRGSSPNVSPHLLHLNRNAQSLSTQHEEDEGMLMPELPPGWSWFRIGERRGGVVYSFDTTEDPPGRKAEAQSFPTDVVWKLGELDIDSGIVP